MRMDFDRPTAVADAHPISVDKPEMAAVFRVDESRGPAFALARY